jgi:hypothetical protein
LIFATLGVALALHGRRAIRAQVLNVTAVGTSVAMNVLAAGHGWRDLAIWAMTLIAYALASDTAIGVVRARTLAKASSVSEALADDEATPLALRRCRACPRGCGWPGTGVRAGVRRHRGGGIITGPRDRGLVRLAVVFAASTVEAGVVVTFLPLAAARPPRPPRCSPSLLRPPPPGGQPGGSATATARPGCCAPACCCPPP